ncbi:MAG: exo-beta-N-acetylmuramidase NamZ domain-containing protein [Nitrospinaceae bacterium]
MSRIKTGLDALLAAPSRYLQGRRLQVRRGQVHRLGLVANHTSIGPDLEPSARHINQLDGCQLVRLFAPEHGYYGVEQDMAPVAGSADPATGLPIHSLYGSEASSLAPEVSLFADLDHLIFDIQDVGARYYTFIYTLAHCMEAAGKAGLSVVVLDRPNPINGIALEGNLVREGFFSFVGQLPLLNRHGMTVGELARMFRDHFGIACDLTVAPMQGWRRDMWYDQTGLPWVPPSPNMPTLDTAAVYPGMCLVEGVQLSEGRGVTRPFEVVGAPGVDPFHLARSLNRAALPGVTFRPQYFKPTFQKHAGKVCGGVFLHITDREIFQPVRTGVEVLRAFAAEFPEAFAWRTEPYEFVSDRPAIDLLYGHSGLRTGWDQAVPKTPRLEGWEEDREHFSTLRRPFLLY